MKLLYFISFLSWLGYAFFTYQAGDASSYGGGAVGDYLEEQANFNFFVASLLVGLYAIVMNISVMANGKIKGMNVLAVLVVLLSAGLIFWTYIMLSSRGVSFDEIYYGLIVIAIVSALLSIIIQTRVNKGLKK